MSNYSFNAEIPKLMNMIIHNFYSSKDIFIRELISNASDAIDKVKYESLNKPTYLESNTDFSINIKSDKENKTLIIEDSGIGMTETDLINCLGTIAKSGTEEFVKNMMASTSEKSTLIGQFGVGFYSAFLVADRVQVYTKHPESDKVLVWESDAVSGYTIAESDLTDLKRGSRIVLYIKEDQSEYLEYPRITEIVKKHSGFTSYPIYLIKKTKVSKPKTKPVEISDTPSDVPTDSPTDVATDVFTEPSETSTETSTEPTEQTETSTEPTEQTETSTEPITEETGQDTQTPENMNKELEDLKEMVDKVKNVGEDGVIESESDEELEEKEKEPEVEMEEVEEIVYDKLNNESIWMRNPTEVKPEEYSDFYKSISSDYDTYQKVKHFRAEGNVEFSSILYVPKHAPHDMFEKKPDKSNIKLYVKRVLITDNCPDLYPEYFNFVKGVVDCPDLPLNASRELLQQSKITKQISKALIKKTIEMFNDIAEDEEEYEKFYNNFSKNIKLAIHEDKVNKDKFMDFLRFPTSKSDSKLISLDTYIEQMKENQAGIYYINSDSMTSASSSPFVEKLIANDYQVIYMIESIDEYLMQNNKEYKSKQFINVANDDLKLETTTDAETEKTNNELCTKLKEILGSKVDKVVISKKLVSQPAIVSSATGISANMERIMKAQTLGNDNMLKYMSGHKVLEINPEHKLIQKLTDLNYDSEYVNLVYEMGLLAGGYTLDNMNEFLSKVYTKI